MYGRNRRNESQQSLGWEDPQGSGVHRLTLIAQKIELDFFLSKGEKAKAFRINFRAIF